VEDRVSDRGEHQSYVGSVCSLGKTKDQDVSHESKVSHVAVLLYILWIQVQMCSVDLVEPPQEILGRPIDIVAT